MPLAQVTAVRVGPARTTVPQWLPQVQPIQLAQLDATFEQSGFTWSASTYDMDVTPCTYMSSYLPTYLSRITISIHLFYFYLLASPKIPVDLYFYFHLSISPILSLSESGGPMAAGRNDGSGTSPPFQLCDSDRQRSEALRNHLPMPPGW